MIDSNQFKSKNIFHLPTIVKYSSDGENENKYVLSTLNRRNLIKDYSCLSGRHLEVFENNYQSVISYPVRMTAIDQVNPNTEPNNQNQRQNRRTVINQPQQPPPPQHVNENQSEPPPSRSRRNENRNGGLHQIIDPYDDYIFDKKLRKQFIFKVYVLLTILLLFSFSWCIISNLVTPIKLFLKDYWWIAIIFLVLYLAVSITLACATSLRRSYPTNLILLCCLCICMTVILSVVSAFSSIYVISLAIGTAISITIAISIFAKFSPWDVTGCGLLVCILCVGFMLFGIVTCILCLIFNTPILMLVYSAIGLLIYSFFLYFDTQQILGGRRVQFSPEEYILGTLLLYVDILMIFLMLLNIYTYAK